MNRISVILLLVAAVLIGGCAKHPPTGIPRSSTVTTLSKPAAVRSMEKSVPVSLDIPKIKARSTLTSLGLAPDGTVELPPASTPMQASWFDVGPTPGELGSAVIFGHVDADRQAGIFFRLRELGNGDLIFVHRADGSTATFEVTKVEEIPNGTLPTAVVSGKTSDAELRLITCDGWLDGSAHSYHNNVIVFAALT